MSWGEKPEDFTGEPRKVFINFLIWNVKQIDGLVFYHRRPSHAIQPIMGVVDSLDKKDKETLKPIYEKLVAMRLGKVPIKTGDVENIYSEVLNHLHSVYFQEFFRRRLGRKDLKDLDKGTKV